MFKQAERLKDEDTEQLQQIVQQACQELTLHTQVEEQFFYPALEDALDEKKQDLVREANVEHTSAKELIAKLQAMGPDDEDYKATFKVLGEYVNHHIEEEEKQMFPAAKRAKLDLKAIGQQILAAKQDAGEGVEQGMAEERETATEER